MSEKKKAFISGPMTGIPDYETKFLNVQEHLETKGFLVMNPVCLPEGFDTDDYMQIAYAMISICDTIVMLPGWENSDGAKLELAYAINAGKTVELGNG